LDSNAGIPLQGVAIGNGWIDAKRQYPAYIEYAVKMEILKETSDVRSTPSWSSLMLISILRSSKTP